MTGSLAKKNGKYHVVLSYKDEDMVRRQKWISTGLDIKNNKRKAEEFLKEILREYEDKNIKLCKTILFCDFILEWLEVIKSNICANTYENYRMVINTHIVPYFRNNGIKLQDLQPNHLQKYYNYKIECGLSPNTIYKHHANIHKCLKYALTLNLIAYNPADRVQLPKKKKYIAKYLNNEQLKKLFQLVKGSPIESAVYLTANLGLRRSEVLGLQWDAVDFEKKAITIKRTAINVKGAVLYQDNVKTASSYRTLPLTPTILGYLKKLLKEQKEHRLLLGSEYNENSKICKFENGDPLKPDFVSHTFKRIMEQNDLPVIRFHDLRHPYVKPTTKKYLFFLVPMIQLS